MCILTLLAVKGLRATDTDESMYAYVNLTVTYTVFVTFKCVLTIMLSQRSAITPVYISCKSVSDDKVCDCSTVCTNIISFESKYTTPTCLA